MTAIYFRLSLKMMETNQWPIESMCWKRQFSSVADYTEILSFCLDIDSLQVEVLSDSDGLFLASAICSTAL